MCFNLTRPDLLVFHLQTTRTDYPAFLATFGAELPWNDEAIWTKVLMHEQGMKPEFHKIDIFHTITLGVGKSYAASCLVTMQVLMNGTSIEERFKELTSFFLEYCRATRLKLDNVLFICLSVFFWCTYVLFPERLS